MITRIHDYTHIPCNFSSCVTYKTITHKLSDLDSIFQLKLINLYTSDKLCLMSLILVIEIKHELLFLHHWISKLLYVNGTFNQRKSDGSLNRCKAFLVDKAYSQSPGINYTDTFILVVKPTDECWITYIFISIFAVFWLFL